MQQFLIYFPLCLAALVAGIVNALAGGGTLLTFPALIAALGPRYGVAAAVIANGTSTVALAPASFSSAWAFRQEIGKVRRWLVLLILPSLLGGALGSLLVIVNPERYFALLVPWLILAAATLFALQPFLTRRVTISSPAEHQEPSTTTIVAIVIAQFFIGVYGGYFGAGIGILMLSSLGIMGMTNIHEMNALKTVLAGCINGMAVLIFVWNQKVEWPLALAMMAAAILGGYLGARFGRKVQQKYIRWFVIAVGFSLAAWYFWQQFASAGPETKIPPDSAARIEYFHLPLPRLTAIIQATELT
ncbi:MAG: sulfite exporter TauE/SafE family protein [Pirellulaceae bacterium]